MMNRIRRTLIFSACIMPAIIPVLCARPVLRLLTPFLIDGSNDFLVDVINFAAPLVLPRHLVLTFSGDPKGSVFTLCAER